MFRVFDPFQCPCYVSVRNPNTSWREGGRACEIVAILQRTELDDKQVTVPPVSRFDQIGHDHTKEEKELSSDLAKVE